MGNDPVDPFSYPTVEWDQRLMKRIENIKMLDIWCRRTGQPVSAAAVSRCRSRCTLHLRIVRRCLPLAWYPTDYFDQPLFTPSRSKARSSIPFEMMPTYCWSSSTTGTAQGACPT